MWLHMVTRVFSGYMITHGYMGYKGSSRLHGYIWLQGLHMVTKVTRLHMVLHGYKGSSR